MGLYQMLSVITLVALTAVSPAHSDTPPLRRNRRIRGNVRKPTERRSIRIKKNPAVAR